MTRLRSTLLAVLLGWAGPALAQETPTFRLTLRAHKFEPAELQVPAGVRFVLALLALGFIPIALFFLLVAGVVAKEVMNGMSARGGMAAALGFVGLLTGLGAWLCLRPLVATTVRIGTDGALRTAEITGQFFDDSELTYTISIDAYDVEQEITKP